MHRHTMPLVLWAFCEIILMKKIAQATIQVILLIALYKFRSWIKLSFQLYKLSLGVNSQIQFCFTTEQMKMQFSYIGLRKLLYKSAFVPEICSHVPSRPHLIYDKPHLLISDQAWERFLQHHLLEIFRSYPVMKLNTRKGV